jgi:hypothetical protein
MSRRLKIRNNIPLTLIREGVTELINNADVGRW